MVLVTQGPFLSPDGTISSSSILLAQSLQHCVRSQTCSATDLFYQGGSRTLREWLGVAITRTLHQGEDSLLELTKQICSFLQVKGRSLSGPHLGIQVSIRWLSGLLTMTLCIGLLFDALLPCPIVVSFLRSAFLSPAPALTPGPGSVRVGCVPDQDLGR